MPESWRICLGLIEKLASDAPLALLLPDGVWRHVAPEGASRFAIVALVSATDEGEFGRRAIEDGIYLVEARVLSTSEGNVDAAAARIDALLEDGFIDVPGYGCMAITRDEFVDGIEVDDQDVSIQWHRSGGHYRVQMTPTSEVSGGPPSGGGGGGWIQL
jgi:hypothetical protein